MKHFMEIFLAIVASISAIMGILGAGYAMLDEEYKLATQGWVLGFFGARNNFSTLTTANININYYERERCKGKILQAEQHELLNYSYEFFAEIKGYEHRYRDGTMTPDEVCLDRLNGD